MRDRYRSVERKLAEQWRMTCPEHHHHLEDKAGPSVYCKQCGHAYRYEELIDKREQATRAVVPPGGERPVDEPPIDER